MSTDCKIRGINDVSTSFHGHGRPEPIGLEYIAAPLVNAGYRVSFISDSEIEVYQDHKPIRISFFTSFTNSWPEVKISAKKAKKKGNYTVAGGYHVCGTTKNISRDYFDIVVHGEGEEICVEIADALIRKMPNSKLENIINDSPCASVLYANRIENLDDLSWPLREAKYLNRYNLYGLVWPPPSEQRNGAILLASRGCAHSCDFCASESVWGKGIRFRSPDDVVAELKDLKARFDTNTFVFIDQSLGQAKKWTFELCNAVQKANLGMNWYHQSNLSIHTSVVKAMADAGCAKIGFGLEGISPSAVKKIKNFNPHNLEVTNKLFDYCNSLGIFVKVYLMIGYPWETPQIIDEYFEWISRIRANEIKISYITPFPGTRDWEKYKDKLISNNWSDFDTVQMPVIRNEHITVEHYKKIRDNLFHAFYGSSTYDDITMKMLQNYPHYKDSYRQFADFLIGFGMISGKETWLHWVEYSRPENSSIVAVG